MVCYLIKFGNEKPPRERFVVVLYFIPVCTGNTKESADWASDLTVYPCAYREHLLPHLPSGKRLGLSLCIQGTRSVLHSLKLNERFIPVYTGNSSCIDRFSIISPVYPCAYRELFTLPE